MSWLFKNIQLIQDTDDIKYITKYKKRSKKQAGKYWKLKEAQEELGEQNYITQNLKNNQTY